MKMNNFSIYKMYLTICKNLSVPPPSTVACPPSKKFLVTALAQHEVRITEWKERGTQRDQIQKVGGEVM